MKLYLHAFDVCEIVIANRSLFDGVVDHVLKSTIIYLLFDKVLNV